MRFYKIAGCLLMPTAAIASASDSNSLDGEISNFSSTPINYKLSIFSDSTFSKLHSSVSNPKPFIVGHPLYFSVKASQIMPNIEFSLLTCQVKSADQTLSYPILKNMCPSSLVQTKILSSLSDPHEIKAKYNVFEFIRDAEERVTNTIHISCQVILCDSRVEGNACKSGCVNKNVRKRREIEMVNDGEVEIIEVDGSFDLKSFEISENEGIIV